MKIKLFIVILVCHFFAGALLSNAHAANDAILAVVDEEVITTKDLRDYAQSAYVNFVAKGFDAKMIQEAMLDMEINGLNRLIEDKIILNRANALELKVREKVVDDKLLDIKKNYPTEEEFLNAIVKSGATITDIRNKIRDQLKIQFTINHEVKSKIYVNPQEVTQYYEEHKSNYEKKERIMLDSIFITFRKDKSEAEQRAKDAIAKINAGSFFEDVAKEYSDTPSLGLVERGQFMPVIEDTVFNLKPDEITPPVAVDTGIYIFKLKSKLNAEIASIEEVKESISDSIYRQKFKVKFEKWVEDLKKKAYVEIKK